MAGGAYGKELGESLGVEAPPAVITKILHRAPFAATRVSWSQRQEGFDGLIGREQQSFLVCLQLRDLPSHPYWVAGRPVPMPSVRQGQFTLLDLNFDHAAYHRDPLDCLAVYVPRGALDTVADEHGARRVDTLRIPPASPLDDLVVRSLGHALLPALDQPHQVNRLFVDSIAVALIAHLASTYGGMPTDIRLMRGGLAPWQERRTKELLMANIDGEITLDQLAHSCGLSRSHFARAFKRTTGSPPHRWLLYQRVERARDMLLNTSRSLEQIAALCGFADQSHFTRVFASITGASPGEWRRSRRT